MAWDRLQVFADEVCGIWGPSHVDLRMDPVARRGRLGGAGIWPCSCLLPSQLGSGLEEGALWEMPAGGWYPDQELNLDPRFRKPLLYPFELSGREIRQER